MAGARFQMDGRRRPASPRLRPPGFPARLTADLALWVLLATALHCARPSTESGPAPASPPTRLKLGVAITREIQSGEIHRFRLAVPAGHYLRVSAEARHVDVELVLTGPGGTPESGFLLPAESWRPESLAAVADAAGSWKLEVRGQTPEEARSEFRLRCEELRPATATDPHRVAALQAHGKGLELSASRARKNDEEALAELHRALQLWRQADDVEGEATTLQLIGGVETDLFAFDAAAASLGRTLALERQLGRRDRETDAIYRLGVLDNDRGRYREALERLRLALEFYQEHGDREPAAFALMHLGFAHSRRTELQAALDHYRRALELLRELGMRKWQANALNNVGATLQNLGEVDEAREYFEQALPISRQLGDRAREAAMLNNIGWGLKAQGEFRQALHYLRQALAIAEELDNGRLQAIYLDNIGRAYLELGEPRKTLWASRQALELCRRLGDRRGQAVRHNSLGLAHEALGEIPAAAANFEQALAISREIGNPENELAALFGHARLHRMAGDLEAAQALVEEALEVVEDVRTAVGNLTLKASYLASRRALYEFRVDLLVGRARRQPERERELLGAALTAQERARARSLLESLSEALADVRSGADPQLLEKERALRTAINDAERRRKRLAAESGGAELKSAERTLRKHLVALQNLWRRIRTSSPRYGELTQPRPLGLEEIQHRVLDGESLLLEYAFGDARSHLFAVTAEEIEVFELPGRSEIEAAARPLYELVTQDPGWPDTDPEVYREAAARLSGMVLGPLAGRLAGQRLLLVTEGTLQYVPFAALPLPGDSGRRWLVEEHEIVSLPSASVMAVLRRQVAGRPPAPGILAVVADPVFSSRDPRVRRSSENALSEPLRTTRNAMTRSARDAGLTEFEPLPGSRLEADAIAAQVGPEQSFKALDFAASRATVTSAAMGRYQILHFATHGFLNDRTPELSGLVLSLYDEGGVPQDGFLRLHDIYNLELNADLVVLSACRTALGKQIPGEGLIGLTRGFMYAGARRVVASLWRVDDDATAELMERFYRAMLADGLPPAAALRAAQIEMLRGEATREEWRQPFYWAAFVLQGEWREVR